MGGIGRGVLKLYKLNEKHEVVEVGEFLDCIKSGYTFKTEPLRQTFILHCKAGRITKVLVSTVFLCIEHPGGMFETMVFGGIAGDGEIQYRCHTHTLALFQHAMTVAEVKDSFLGFHGPSISESEPT
jgi:hypothetical protein